MHFYAAKHELYCVAIHSGNHYINISEIPVNQEWIRSSSLLLRALLWSFYYSKNLTLTVLSNFREFLKLNYSLESLKMNFRNRSPKGSFGQNMSHVPNGSVESHWKIANKIVRRSLHSIKTRKQHRYTCPPPPARPPDVKPLIHFISREVYYFTFPSLTR